MQENNRLYHNRYHILLANLLLLSFILILSTIVSHAPVVHATDQGESPLSTIYHVYLDDDYLGAVQDKAQIDQHIDDQLDEKNETDEVYTYGYDQELFFIPERVFFANIDIARVLAELDKKIEIDIQATTVQFNDKQLGHFASAAEAEQAIFEYKSLYVDEDILKQLADEADQAPELEVGDLVVVDVSLSEDVTFSKSIVSEDELLTVEEAVRLFEKGTLEDKVHKVAKGDTLYSIGKTYDLTEEKLLELNEDLAVEDILQLEQEIHVTDYVPFVDVIVYEESLKKETVKFEKKTEQTDMLYRGDTEKTQSGKNGEVNVHRGIEKVNGKIVDREVLDQEVIKEVQDEITLEGTKVIPSRGTKEFAWPAVGGYISSHYGPRWGSFHKGTDIARPTNRDILASDNGTVESVSYNRNGYGNYIIINHNNGYKTLYAHLSSSSVSVGQTVPKGTKIGRMGSTGRSTGMHLHFEVMKNGTTVNPNDYLN